MIIKKNLHYKIGLFLIIAVIALFSISLTTEAQYLLIGFVNNSTAGYNANGFSVAAYKADSNPSGAASGTVGINGNGDETNWYDIDCLTATPQCNNGELWTVVIYNQNNYLAGPINFTIDDLGGYALPPDMQINDMPNITNITPANNTVYLGLILINATVRDEDSISSVFIAVGNSSGNYSVNGSLLQNGIWNFTDVLSKQGATDYYNISIDTTKFADGNYIIYLKANDSTTTNKLFTYVTWKPLTFNNSIPDLMLNSLSIAFDSNSIIENTNLTINITAYNDGAGNANNVTVQLVLGNISGTLVGNKSVNISAQDSVLVQINWTVAMGTYNFFAIIDPPNGTGYFNETNESNNVVNKTLLVPSIQTYYGNLTGSFILGDNKSNAVFRWPATNTNGSIIFITDSESVLSFSFLQAIGRDTSNNSVTNDFENLDQVMNTTGLSDNLNNTYTYNSQPIKTMNITVKGANITFVPIVNSTNNSNFVTGILWDTSDGGTQYTGNTQDITFIALINKNVQGRYGFYDFEIKIPANLRKYYYQDNNSVSFYTELK